MFAFVAAQTEFEEGLDEVADTVKETVGGGGFGEWMSNALESLFGEKEMLSRVFFALLLGMIIYTVIESIFAKSSKLITWGITIIITALAMLGLPSGFLEAVRISYGAMGAAILAIIPFIIILVFSLRTRSVLLARITWIFYVIYYFALYLQKIFGVDKAGWLSGQTIPYLAGIVAGIAIFILLGTMRRWLFKGEIAGIKESGEKGIMRGKLLKDLKKKELEEVYGGE